MAQHTSNQMPFAVVLIDPATGNQATQLSVLLAGTSTIAEANPYGANYTQINSNGTTTVNPNPGFYYGLQAVSLGTLWVTTVYDIVGTATYNLTPASLSVGALGSIGLAAPAGVGLKTKGALVVVTSGTAAGNLNVLWD